MSGTSAQRLVTAVLLLSLAALAAALCFQDIRAFDYWWHLRTGALIAETGSVPRVDPYSFTVPGARWVDIHWLHQVGLHSAYELGGHAGVVVAKAVVVLLLVAILGSIGFRRKRAALTVVAVSLTLLVSADRFMPRPELPTFVFLAAVLALLDRFERKPDAGVYAVVGVQLLWVNVHGLFALGIALCAIHLLAELLRPLVVPGSPLRRERLRRLVSLTVLASLASLANPNFLDGALYPIQQLGMIGPPEDRGIFGSLIAELLPPIGSRRPLDSAATVLVGLLAAGSFAAMALNWRRIQAGDPLVWVAFLYLGLGAQRNIALFAIIAAPILVRNANEFLDARSRPLQTPLLVDLSVIGGLLLLTAAAASGDLLPKLGSSREPGFDVMGVFHPERAVDWIERERPPGPICHHMADGGYLMWRLHPDYPVMVDGRLEVYGPEKFVELQVGDSANFRALDAEYDFGTILVHYSLVNSSELLRWLYFNSNWRLAFVDEVAAVFVRVGPETGTVGIDIDAPHVLPPLEEEPSVSNQMRLMARTNLFSTLRRYERALANWKQAIERYPEMEQGPVVHAYLLQKNGFGAAAEAILRAELEERPEEPSLHTQIGDLRMDNGDVETARAHYDRALEIDPSFPYAMFRSAQLAERVGDRQGALQLYLRVLGQGARASSLAGPAAARVRALTGGV